MKQLRETTYFILLITLLIPTGSLCQNALQSEPSKEKLMNAAQEIIAAAGTVH